MNPNSPPAGIQVDTELVNRRAYSRIASLTLLVDQWETAYEALTAELDEAHAELARLRNGTASSGEPTTRD